MWGAAARITCRRWAGGAKGPAVPKGPAVSKGKVCGMVEGLRDHPLRGTLNAEVHSRPFAALQAPERISHLALLSGEGAAERERQHVAALCESRGVAAPPADRKSGGAGKRVSGRVDHGGRRNH